MNNNNKDSEESKKLLDKAYSCKSKDLNSLLRKIESELESNPNNQTALRAKRVVTSRLASKNN